MGAALTTACLYESGDVPAGKGMNDGGVDCHGLSRGVKVPGGAATVKLGGARLCGDRGSPAASGKPILYQSHLLQAEEWFPVDDEERRSEHSKPQRALDSGGELRSTGPPDRMARRTSGRHRLRRPTPYYRGSPNTLSPRDLTLQDRDLCANHHPRSSGAYWRRPGSGSHRLQNPRHQPSHPVVEPERWRGTKGIATVRQ
jgi:hypothetical protein